MTYSDNSSTCLSNSFCIVGFNLGCDKSRRLALEINLMVRWISRFGGSLSRRSSEKTTDFVIIGVTSGRFGALPLGETLVIIGVTSNGIGVMSVGEILVNSVMTETTSRGYWTPQDYLP